jgi:membrane-bound lytic murein transglycosylase D
MIVRTTLRTALFLAPLVLVACAPRHAARPEPAPPPRITLPPPQYEVPAREPEPEPAVAPSVLDLVDFSSFTMPVQVNEHVLSYIDMFTGRARGRFEQWLQRQGQYEPMIQQQLAARDIPPELIYLALIESGFVPTAVSSASAVGIWQFMAPTGRMEGLRIDEFVDERRDPIRATEAAARHLRRLHDRYGSWYLAAAAYNAGSGRIDRALAAGVDGRRGDDELFWEIRHLLPTETRNYVPQLIAASIVGTHRHLFGFDGVPQQPLAFDTVEVPDATEFAVLAEAAGVAQTTIAALNPHYIREMTPPGRSSTVRLPVGRGEPFRVAYAQIPADQ